MDIGILTVSSAYLSKKKCFDEKIYVIDLVIYVNEQKYYESELQPEEFLLQINTKNKISTSQPSPQEFLQAFQKMEQTFSKLLVFVLSKHFSGAYNSAKLAQKLYDGKMRIEIIDTLTASVGMENIIDYTLEERKKTTDFTILVNNIKSYIENISTYLMIDDLSILAKNGRLKSIQAIIGRLMLVKVLLYVND